MPAAVPEHRRALCPQPGLQPGSAGARRRSAGSRAAGTAHQITASCMPQAGGPPGPQPAHPPGSRWSQRWPASLGAAATLLSSSQGSCRQACADRRGQQARRAHGTPAGRMAGTAGQVESTWESSQRRDASELAARPSTAAAPPRSPPAHEVGLPRARLLPHRHVVAGVVVWEEVVQPAVGACRVGAQAWGRGSRRRQVEGSGAHGWRACPDNVLARRMPAPSPESTSHAASSAAPPHP